MSTRIINKLKRLHRIWNGSTIEYDLSFYQISLDKIDALQDSFMHLDNQELKDISKNLMKAAGENKDSSGLLIEAYALVRETIKRVLKISPFDVQMLGAIAMHYRKLIEMKTGEGKTLTAVFPAYLNALSGNGVHVLTFNDYLARRDAEWMRPVYEFLGLSVGVIQEGMSIEERKKAYNSDITYLTAKEAGFDFLRDSLCYETENIVQRNFNFAVIDEADSILIDEARLPLIIAGASDEQIQGSIQATEIARKLLPDIHFEFDEYARNILFTEAGEKRVEELLHVNNLYDNENIDLLTKVNCALHAEHLLTKDVDYIIRDEKVELVDEFTGRIANKRRWPDGLQAAIEAKENLDTKTKGRILNSITLQHFIRHYSKIAGMTATAQTAEKEFNEFYDLHIVVLPPNKQCARIDNRDILFKSREAKLISLVNEIVEVHKRKQPVLVGTRSVVESEELAAKLKSKGIKCNVLNAKNDELEAAIIAGAGRLGAVTISTNMAGRGTDIKLGANNFEKQKVAELGGLYVIGTNRHESRRIDNQLRGRAGRQGDPGMSRFFISMEDDLFIKYNLKQLLPENFISDYLDEKIDNPVISKEVDRVQRIIEGQNLEIKKTLYKYSALLEQQRQIMQEKRDAILNNHSVTDLYYNEAKGQFNFLQSKLDDDELARLCRFISLFHIDNEWSNYLADMEDLREGIHLLRLGGEEPILKFRKSSIEMFERMQNEINREMVESFNRLKINKEGTINYEKTGIKMPSATWTYLVNDNPFEGIFGTQLIGNISLSIGGGTLGLLFIFYQIWRKLKEKRK